MKKILVITVLLICTILLSCNSNAQEDASNSRRNLTMLIDITDEKIFSDIDEDIRTNLPFFLQSTNIGKISYQETFTVSVGMIESTDDLLLKKESISLPKQQYVSRQRAAELSNPRLIMHMIDNQLISGKSIAAKKHTKSPIVEIILKSLRELTPEAQEIILIFSDGVEYSDAANFYKNIPFSDETFEKYYATLDPFIIQEATSKIALTQPTVVFYLKTSEEGINKANLKRFYSKFFEKIGVTNYMFLDNLTQNVQSLNID